MNPVSSQFMIGSAVCFVGHVRKPQDRLVASCTESLQADD